MLLDEKSHVTVRYVAAVAQVLPVCLLSRDSLNETAGKKGTNAEEVKGPIPCDLLVWCGLIEDNDPHSPLQHEINTNRPAHSPFGLSEF